MTARPLPEPTLPSPAVRRSSPSRLAAAPVALLAVLAPAVGVAQAVAPEAATAYAPATFPELPKAEGSRDPALIEAERTLRGAELEKIRRDIELSAERRAEIEAEITAIEKDRSRLNDELLSAAARVQGLEQSLSASEGRLARHADNEAAIRTSLESRRAILAEVIAAGMRIGRRPPPALVVKPEDALGAVRSAILLGAVLPEIRVEADALASDLSALVAVRREAEAERDRLKTDATRLAEDQQRLTLLLAEKRKHGESRASELAAEAEKAAELAARAESLEELTAALDRELKPLRRDEARAEPARPGDPGRLAPAIPFSAAKGLLSLPVHGVAVQSYGDDNDLGGTAEGMSLATRAGARVTAPADGRVAYAGPFRSYGQLLILDAGDGYHVVLAGMERIDVELGQFVLTGEPVGVMGSQRLASATAPEASISQPVLYIEFRKDGASIDPAPWWAASQDRKVRG